MHDTCKENMILSLVPRVIAWVELHSRCRRLQTRIDFLFTRYLCLNRNDKTEIRGEQRSAAMHPLPASVLQTSQQISHE